MLTTNNKINENKYITWKALIKVFTPIIFIICVGLLGASWTLAGSNATKQHTHKDSVKYRELKHMEENIKTIKDDVRDIHNFLHTKDK